MKSRTIWEIRKGYLIAICIIVAIIMGVGLSMAIELNEFGVVSSENLTFTGNENIIRNITIFKDANMSSAYMNISGNKANLTHWVDSGGDYSIVKLGPTTSRVGINMSLTNIEIENIYFMIYYSGSPTGDIIVRFRNITNDSIIYSKNFGTLTDKIPSSIGILTEFNISDSPLISDSIYITIERTSTDDTVTFLSSFISNPSGIPEEYFKTYNSFNSILYTTDYYFSGPRNDVNPPITIILANSPNNSYIKINNTNIWNYTGEFNISETTSDFSSTLNVALDGGACTGGTLSGNNCIIPFIFHSDTAGILEYSNLNITWTEAISPNQTIITPTGEYQTTEIPYNITASDNDELESCSIWVTRGASLEVTETMLDCSNNMVGNVYVSSQFTTYTFHSNITDRSGNSNYTNQTFSTSEDAIIISAPDGSGGGSPDIKEEDEELINICEQYVLPLQEAWNNFINNINEDNFIDNLKLLWVSFWDKALCDSAGSIVPLS